MAPTHRYRPLRFFLTTTVATWTPWLIGAYLGSRPGQQGTASLLNLVGLLAPMAVGLYLIGSSGDSALKADLKDRIVNLRRIQPRYLLTAVLMPPVTMALAIWVSVRLGESPDQFRLSSSDNLAGMIVLAMVLAPIIEEVGWRGYGVDSLRAKLGMLPASLLFGVLWSLWHAPLVLIAGTYQHELATMANPLFLANFFVSVIPAAVVANWLYYRNNRSILAAVLLHAMLNAAAVLPNASQVAKVIVTLVYLVIALGLVAFDRTTFGAGPRDFVADPAQPRI